MIDEFAMGGVMLCEFFERLANQSASKKKKKRREKMGLLISLALFDVPFQPRTMYNILLPSFPLPQFSRVKFVRGLHGVHARMTSHPV